MTHKDPTARELQAIQTKNRIYETAVDLIRRKGYEKVSINEICRAAGVSIGLFYYYYPAKQDILIDKFQRADKYFNEYIRNGLSGPGVEEKIRQFVKGYLEFVQQDGLDLMKNFYSTGNSFFVKKGRAMQQVLSEVIAEGQADGLVRSDMEPGDCVDFIFTVLRGVVFDWCLRDGSYDLVKDTSRYADMIIGYVLV